MIEMVLDDALAASRDEHKLLYSRFLRFLDRILHQGLVDDGQHLLWHGLAGRQKTRAHSSDREHGLADHRGGFGHEAGGIEGVILMAYYMPPSSTGWQGGS